LNDIKNEKFRDFLLARVDAFIEIINDTNEGLNEINIDSYNNAMEKFVDIDIKPDFDIYTDSDIYNEFEERYDINEVYGWDEENYIKKVKEIEDEKGIRIYTFMRHINQNHKELDIDIDEAERMFIRAQKEVGYLWSLYCEGVGYSCFYDIGIYNDKFSIFNKLLKRRKN